MDGFTHQHFKTIIHVETLVTLLYLEFSKDFFYAGESHDFWELVYIDKGEMICTLDHKQFILKGGELTFHRPNEYHNLSSNGSVAPNVSIVTFSCHSKAMKHFENKIVQLSLSEKDVLSELMQEGLSCYKRLNPNPPIMGMVKYDNAPIGAEQMTKNLLEIFLIKLYRSENVLSKSTRAQQIYSGKQLPWNVQEILLYLSNNLYRHLTLIDMATELHISESTLKKLFATFKSGGICHHFNELKIAEAKKLIREKQFNFTQISEKLAFDNLHYFSHCFSSITHMTPTEYKNSIV